MGGRLSTPRSPSGSEESALTRPPTRRDRFPFTINRRTILAPISVVLLGSIFYMYSVTTVAAAKENARRARLADGGKIDWRREGLRRHGRLAAYEHRGLWDQLVYGDGLSPREAAGMRAREAEAARGGAGAGIETAGNAIEEGIRRAREGRGGGLAGLRRRGEDEDDE